MAHFFQRLMLSKKYEFLAFEILIEDLHSPHSCCGFQKERGIIFFMILELMRRIGNGVIVVKLVLLCQNCT
jgi:hypothetical protein